ncbi:MAG: undecaprenyldiphospho-muramoylpentapeptide beta-N-acetylglucosaminyltransferase [Firmicutes bacterium]|nr:undecaprenyldiphospho-muramoylpentapeptide beta-N-acetylglucosaminyltransferase [Bacillota bacterium]
MRMIITGGGTGGHIYPALTLARYAKAQDPAVEILFVGSERGLEKKIVPAAGFAMETIPASGFGGSLRRLGSFSRDLWRGLQRARRLMASFRPDVVFGTGGYVAAPVILAARLAGRPAALHEQNAVPGLANRMLAPLVQLVCLSFEESRDAFPRRSRTAFTGNPRASEVAAVDRAAAQERLRLDPSLKTIVAYGGSRGALRINEVMVEFLKAGWLPPGMQLIYVTGDIYYRRVKEELGLLPGRVQLYPYLEEMPLALAAADLVITRAGATTLAEITALGLPAILVPSPNVANNHQYYNARLLERAGAALLIEEKNFHPYRLRRELEKLRAEPALLERMARAGAKLAVPDAAARVYRCLCQLAERGREN